jgi:hypothetical protein
MPVRSLNGKFFETNMIDVLISKLNPWTTWIFLFTSTFSQYQELVEYFYTYEVSYSYIYANAPYTGENPFWRCDNSTWILLKFVIHFRDENTASQLFFSSSLIARISPLKVNKWSV